MSGSQYWRWLSLILSTSGSSSLFLRCPEREHEKEAGLFHARDRLWNIDAMMSASYTFVCATNGNWNVISVCTCRGAICVDASINIMTLQFSGPLGDCGWIIANVVVSQRKEAKSPPDCCVWRPRQNNCFKQQQVRTLYGWFNIQDWKQAQKAEDKVQSKFQVYSNLI